MIGRVDPHTAVMAVSRSWMPGTMSPDDAEAQEPVVSVVIPVRNEEDNVEPLYAALVTELERLGTSYEVIFVDDGSQDETYPRLSKLGAVDESLKLIRLRRNFGQTAAMSAGFDRARGSVIVTMDGDLQNDPRDIPRLLEKMSEGYDVVSGWRLERKDGFVRRLPSRIANWLIGRVTGVKLHDYGCTLKAYRAQIVQETRLYGEMHRFLPALAVQMGAQIAEIPVDHHPRVAGKSNYGLSRTAKVLLDLMTVKFLSVWLTKPSYVFGGSGSLLCIAGSGFVLWTAYEKLVNGIYVYRQPALIVGVFLFTIGVNLILMGLLAELITRTYHESQGKPIYHVREQMNVVERKAG
jgi:glycosyltransferase involved in cell wall biosynthesis